MLVSDDRSSLVPGSVAFRMSHTDTNGPHELHPSQVINGVVERVAGAGPVAVSCEAPERAIVVAVAEVSAGRVRLDPPERLIRAAATDASAGSSALAPLVRSNSTGPLPAVLSVSRLEKSISALSLRLKRTQSLADTGASTLVRPERSILAPLLALISFRLMSLLVA